MGMLEEAAGRILHSIGDACRKHYEDDLVSLAVFGSVARNTQTFESDIDLLIISSDLPRGRMNRMKEFEKIEASVTEDLRNARENGWAAALSPIIRTPEEVLLGGYLYLDMIEEARILYDKDNFFAAFLEDKKAQLETYGARKRTWKGGYYWEIKPDLKPGEVIKL